MATADIFADLWRHRDCSCQPACERYVCQHPKHVGGRSVPACFGCYDERERDMGPLCDDCWAWEERGNGKA